MTTKANTEAVNSGQAEREAFERWITTECNYDPVDMVTQPGGEVYVLAGVQEAWDAWQARAASTATATDGEPVELCRHCDEPTDRPGFCVCNGARHERERIARAAAPQAGLPLQFTDEQIAALRVAADALIERFAAPIRAILANAEQSAAPMAVSLTAPAGEVSPGTFEWYRGQAAVLTTILDAFNSAWPSWYHGGVAGLPGLIQMLADEANAYRANGRTAAPLPRASEQADEAVTDAARDVLAERQRQVTAEGWTPEHDDEHDSGEMADAAAAYTLHASGWTESMPREVWPAGWSQKWWKPTTPRRDLVKAGALILAEIERLDRATHAKEPK